MIMRTFVTLACICSISISSRSAIPATMDEKPPMVDPSRFPTLTGKLVQLLGHEQGFIRPKAGEPFSLNLAHLANLKQLKFDPNRKSYIPLAGPLAVESVHYFRNGDFANMRLVSRGSGRRRVTVDIVPAPGRGANFVQVWVLIEHEVTHGVALIECETSGKSPGRPKTNTP